MMSGANFGREVKARFSIAKRNFVNRQNNHVRCFPYWDWSCCFVFHTVILDSLKLRKVIIKYIAIFL